jgi:hypothetical protein
MGNIKKFTQKHLINFKGGEYFGDPGVSGRIVLKYILKKQDAEV